ncbi:DUF2333 family protein [Paraglaciecola sp. Hal342]
MTSSTVLVSLSTSRQGSAQFYVSADNLRDQSRRKRLGNLSQKLCQRRPRPDPIRVLPAITALEVFAEELREQTSWFQLDNNFTKVMALAVLIHFKGG